MHGAIVIRFDHRVYYVSALVQVHHTVNEGDLDYAFDTIQNQGR